MNIAFSHEGEEEMDFEQEINLDNTNLYPLSQLTFVGYSIIAFGIIIVITIFFHKSMSELIKKVVFLLIVILISITTLYLIITTLHLNIISLTKGPVHWHADFEIMVCDKEITLAESKGLSNKQGTDLMHAHNDNRIHVEGVILDKKQASLGAFFYVVGGSIANDGIKVPTKDGLISVHNGDLCNEKPAKLYVFVNGILIDNPSAYVIAPYEKVPPGDRIKIVFSEKAVEEVNPYLTEIIDKGIPPMTIDTRLKCDLDVDADCDNDDYLLFNKVVGQCDTGNNYNELADADHNGCVTEADRQLLFPKEGLPPHLTEPKTGYPPQIVSEESPQLLCDLNGDLDCNNDDLIIIETSIGKCREDFHTSAEFLADFNADGCITSTDKELFLQLMKKYNK